MAVTMQFIKAESEKAWTMSFGTDNNEHILLGEERDCQLLASEPLHFH